MAENYQVTEGVGKSFRSKEIASVHRPVYIEEAITDGGYTPYRNLSLGVTGQVLKASPGQVYFWHLFNTSQSAVAYVKIYDNASAPTHSDTPIFTIPLGPLSGSNISVRHGLPFAAGISVRATTGVADADTGAPAANQVIVNMGIK